MQAHKQAPSLYLRAPTIYKYAATDRPDRVARKWVPRNAAFFVIAVTKVVHTVHMAMVMGGFVRMAMVGANAPPQDGPSCNGHGWHVAIRYAWRE